MNEIVEKFFLKFFFKGTVRVFCERKGIEILMNEEECLNKEDIQNVTKWMMETEIGLSISPSKNSIRVKRENTCTVTSPRPILVDE